MLLGRLAKSSNAVCGKSASCRSEEVGPLSNEKLLDEKKMLLPKQVEHVDYAVVPEAVWEVLVAW